MSPEKGVTAEAPFFFFFGAKKVGLGVRQGRSERGGKRKGEMEGGLTVFMMEVVEI